MGFDPSVVSNYSRYFVSRIVCSVYCSFVLISLINRFYYSTIMSFYHIRTRECTKYESVLHCSKHIAL